jgi:hypothetical protein
VEIEQRRLCGSGFRIRRDGDRDFKVEIEDVPAGDYTLTVGGITRVMIRVFNNGGQVEGAIEFDSDTDDDDELPLNFDTRGKLIEVRQGSTLYFSAQFGDGGGGRGGNFRTDDDGDRNFRLEIEDVLVGDYSLRVGGTLRGTIRVATVTGRTEGEARV